MTAAHSTKSLGRGYAAMTFLAVLVLLTLSWWPSSAGVHPDSVLRLTQGQDRVPVSPYLRILEDPSGELTIQDVASPEHGRRFQPLRGPGVRSGMTEPITYWLRLTYALENAEGEPEAVYLDLGQITKNLATLYAMDTAADGSPAWREHGPLNRYGQAVDQPSQCIHFPLPPPTPRPQIIFVRVEIPLALEALPEIVTRAGLQRRLLVQDLFSGALLGIFAVLALSNLIIFLTLRYAGYLWYALLLLAFSLQVVFLNGLLQDFAPQAGLSQIVGAPGLALGLVGLARLQFIRSFLPLKAYFPRGDRLFIALMVFYLPMVVWPFIWPTFLLMIQVYAGLTILLVLLIMYAGILCWRKGYVPARLFVLAYLPEMLGRFFVFIGYFGFWSPLPVSSFQVHQVGITIEAILLSLALVQRVNTLGQERERIEQEARRKNAEHRERLRSLAGELVRSEERQRKALADDLHDSVSQNLATSLFNLRLLVSRSQDVESSPPLREICDLLGTTLAQTRTLTFDISPPVLHDYGLEAGLEWLAERFQERHGLEVGFQVQGTLPGRDENLEVNLFRAAQELLVNAVKHSRAHKVEISLAYRASQVLLRVSDDGRGMDAGHLARAGAEGFGLFSIRERLQALGGDVEIGSSPGQGTTVILRAPWPQESGPAARGVRQ